MKFRFAILLIFVAQFVLAQNDFPFGKIKVRNFTAKDYTATAQNWDIIQNNEYYFYIANNGGILEFNGESWSKIELENSEHPRSFAKNDTGRIYVGGRGEFGYLDYDAMGKTVYHKLSHPVDTIEFSDVWNVYCIGEHTCFVTSSHIFIYFEQNIEVIEVPDGERIKTSCSIDEVIICTFERTDGDLSYVLRGNKFFEIQNSIKVSPAIIYEEEGKKIIIDDKGNFHEFQQNGSAYQMVLQTNRKLNVGEGFKINNIAIQNNLIVTGTAGNGVLIFDMKGNLVRTFMEKDGLENLEIRKIFFDQYSNIWLGNDNGITFVETSDAITSFDKDFGITGITEDIYLKNGEIYLATHTDLFKSEFGNGTMSFKKQNVFGMELYQLREYTFSDGKTYVLAIANDGVYYLDDQMQKHLIGDLYAWDLFQSTKNPDMIYVGLDGTGVGSISYVNGKFIYNGIYDGTTGEVRSVIEIQGNVYYSVKREGIYLLDTTKNQNENILPGLLPLKDTTNYYEQFTLGVFRDRGYVGTSNGLFEIEGKNLVASELNQGQFIEEKLLVHRIFNDDNEKMWMVIFHKADTKDEYSEIGYMDFSSDTAIWVSAPFKQISDDVIYSLKRDKNGIYWFGGGRKVYAYNPEATSNFAQPFNSYIYQVSLNEDSIFQYNTHKILSTEHRIVYAQNSVRFDFTSTAYLGGLENEYSWYLEGFESDWGKWKSTNFTEYQRLTEGDYVFHVQAKNYYGYESTEATFSFTILPPWYRTAWAYIVYIILFILLIYIIIRVSIARVKSQKEELEKIVQERTHEIAEQNHLLEHQKAEIEEKTNDILDSIKYAKRIQNTILPGEDKLRQIFDHDHFVLYKPKDIVSGDFYWAARFENKTIFSAIDCTGHGVPGAFVSIVGFNGLNRTVNEFKLRQPAAILDKLTDLVVDTFSQSESNIKDGMDIGLCAIDNETLKLEFSGANNPLLLVREKEAIELKPDKQPIGEFEERKPFTNHEIQLQSGDCVYVFSDGYADQFGGPKGKKLKYKALKDLLVEISQLEMKEQLTRLDQAFNAWKGEYEQLDDVCLFGVKIK
ncbi:MAG: SpoIIE family protein phosphatase [Crocinitomicaceae bacterium]|nr:SpoIIE family protein phosphatase [Crocinitomicaceae bacterium]MBK8925142.1 SpoIIE family protein phosphatase [Crocinitomicaceae bacterium]